MKPITSIRSIHWYNVMFGFTSKLITIHRRNHVLFGCILLTLNSNWKKHVHAVRDFMVSPPSANTFWTCCSNIRIWLVYCSQEITKRRILNTNFYSDARHRGVKLDIKTGWKFEKCEIQGLKLVLRDERRVDPFEIDIENSEHDQETAYLDAALHCGEPLINGRYRSFCTNSV